MNKLLFAVLITIILSGCASSNYTSESYFDKDMVDKIIHDKSTIADIESLFGKPAGISMDGDNLIYSYTYIESKSSAQSYVFSMDYKMEGFQRSLSVIFNKNNVVTRYNYVENPMNINSK
jgi:outer membrane protein assembly factor BamE (lipoprotein component of BamABCDE complex)